MWNSETTPSAADMAKHYSSNPLSKKILLLVFSYPNPNLYVSILFLLHLKSNREKPANNVVPQGINKAALQSNQALHLPEGCSFQAVQILNNSRI